MVPSLASGEHRYGVTLVGEALGEIEAAHGKPFVGPAGYTLTRLIELAGLDRARFDIINTVWCRPPDNLLDDQPYETSAIAHCRTQHWQRLLDRSKVIVPMGNVALAAFTGRKGILAQRGYVAELGERHRLVPTVHPSFIRRGQAKYSRAFITDLQKAVTLASHGPEFVSTHYSLDPSPRVAYEWAQAYQNALRHDPGIKLAYDIETPGKGDDEDDLDGEDGRTYHIFRIGFAYTPYGALSVPWEPAYIPAIRMLLGSHGEKVVWNAGFDNPRIAANGVEICGVVHDGMVAWHILHSDLPKGLAFVATFTCPWQPAWKYLSSRQPAFYNATDADVELRSMLWIEKELRRTGLWEVYQRDVLNLNPLLSHMSTCGMPIDPEVRYEKAVALFHKQEEVKASIQALIPESARRIDIIYARTPAHTQGLSSRPGRRIVFVCPACGAVSPTKPHFRVFKRPTTKKPQNPCAGQVAVEKEIEVVEWYRLAAFTPSREQLMRYQQVLGRIIPTKWDKKTRSRKRTMDEKALRKLIGRYPDDPIYDLVLTYRSLDKIAGTYIGKPESS